MPNTWSRRRDWNDVRFPRILSHWKDCISGRLENQSRRKNIPEQTAFEGKKRKPGTKPKPKSRRYSKRSLTSMKNRISSELIESPRKANAATGSARRPRTIFCRLCDWKQKEKIIRSARRIKPPGIFVNEHLNEDLVQETLDKIEEQRPMIEGARRNGKIAAYFVSEGWLLKRELASQLSSCVVLMCFSIL